MTSMDYTTQFGRSRTGAFIRIKPRLRGTLQQKESSSTGAAAESKPQHHHYFGSEYLPSSIHLNKNIGSDVQPKSIDKATIAKEILNEALLSIPKSSLATLKPQQILSDSSMPTDSFPPTYAVPEGKKKMKAKKGQFESTSSPSVGPRQNVKNPPLEPTMIPISHSEVNTSPSFSFAPSISPIIDMGRDRSPINPPLASDVLSKEERTATGVVLTSAVVVVALVLIVVLKNNRKRRKNSSKLNIPDPALCENASISSERSSTFRDEDEKKANDSSLDSSVASKINHIQEMKALPTMPNLRKQNGVALHLMKLINASVEYTKGNRTYQRDSKNEESESFPNLSPYLVDDFSLPRNHRETTLIPILSKLKESKTSLQQVKNQRYSENDGETLLEESDRLAWRAALDLDFNYNANLHDDKLSDDRRPWRSHPYATVIVNEDEDRSINQPSNTASERGTVTKQKSLDEMSMGSVDFINPDIVQQFKTVDQRLSEGFEQFRAVDQRLSDEFDKLEATLLKNGTSDFVPIGKERSHVISSTHEEHNLDLSTGLDKPSCSNPIEEVNNHNDNCLISDDSDDDDDCRRRYQLPHLRPYVSKNTLQQEHASVTATVTSRSKADSALVDPSLAEEDMIPKHAYIVPSNPVSLLNLPNASNRNVPSSIRNCTTGSEAEADDDDDDIMSTSNNDNHDDEYCFQKIRSRFNNQYH